MSWGQGENAQDWPEMLRSAEWVHTSPEDGLWRDPKTGQVHSFLSAVETEAGRRVSE